MSVPSFLYSALDVETQRLAQELASLGGGNARAVNIDVHCILDDRLASSDDQTIWLNGGSIGIRDTALPVGAPIDECMKSVAFTSSHRLQNVLQSPSDHFALLKDISRWVKDGFNVCLMSYGERNSGKTATMFGVDDGYGGEVDVCHSRIAEDALAQGGVAVAILRDLFSDQRAAGGSSSSRSSSSSSGRGYCDGKVTIALSAWTLRGQQVVDLLSTVTKSDCIAMEFASVDCPTLDAAVQVLQVARGRARAHGSKYGGERDRAHLFLRIIRHQDSSESAGNPLGNPLGCSLSHVHLVDLIGTSSSDVAGVSKLQEDDRIANRDTSLQLQSLCKVLSEMRSLSQAQHIPSPAHPSSHHPSSSTYPYPTYPSYQPIPFASTLLAALSSKMQVTSARNSKLTCMLAPLLQGNCRTVLLAHIRDGDSHIKQSKATVSALQGVTQIVSACHRMHGIPLASIPLRHVNTVFAPIPTPPFDTSDPSSSSSGRWKDNPACKWALYPPDNNPPDLLYNNPDNTVLYGSSKGRDEGHPSTFHPLRQSYPPPDHEKTANVVKETNKSKETRVRSPSPSKKVPPKSLYASARSLARSISPQKQKVKEKENQQGMDKEKQQEIEKGKANEKERMSKSPQRVEKRKDTGGGSTASPSRKIPPIYPPPSRINQRSTSPSKDTRERGERGAKWGVMETISAGIFPHPIIPITPISPSRGVNTLQNTVGKGSPGKGLGKGKERVSTSISDLDTLCDEFHLLMSQLTATSSPSSSNISPTSNNPNNPNAPHSPHTAEGSFLQCTIRNQDPGSTVRNQDPGSSIPEGSDFDPFSKQYALLQGVQQGIRDREQREEQKGRQEREKSDNVERKEKEQRIEKDRKQEVERQEREAIEEREEEAHLREINNATTDTTLRSAILSMQSMTRTQKDAHYGAQVGAIQGRIQAQIKRIHRENAMGTTLTDMLSPSSSGNIFSSGSGEWNQGSKVRATWSPGGVGKIHHSDNDNHDNDDRYKVTAGGGYEREREEEEVAVLESDNDDDEDDNNSPPTLNGPLSSSSPWVQSYPPSPSFRDIQHRHRTEDNTPAIDTPSHSHSEVRSPREYSPAEHSSEHSPGECSPREHSPGECSSEQSSWSTDYLQFEPRGRDLGYQERYQERMSASEEEEEEEGEGGPRSVSVGSLREGSERRDGREGREGRGGDDSAGGKDYRTHRDEEYNDYQRGERDEVGQYKNREDIRDERDRGNREDRGNEGGRGNEGHCEDSKNDYYADEKYEYEKGCENDRAKYGAKDEAYFSDDSLSSPSTTHSTHPAHTTHPACGPSHAPSSTYPAHESSPTYAPVYITHTADAIGDSEEKDSLTDLERLAKGDREEEDEEEMMERDLSLVSKRSLYRSLGEERAIRSRMGTRMLRSAEEALERRTQLEIEISDLRKGALLLKAQVRALSSQEPLADIYNTFEDHTQRLIAENEALRNRNHILESRALSAARRGVGVTPGGVTGVGVDGGGSGGGLGRGPGVSGVGVGGLEGMSGYQTGSTEGYTGGFTGGYTGVYTDTGSDRAGDRDQHREYYSYGTDGQTGVTGDRAVTGGAVPFSVSLPVKDGPPSAKFITQLKKAINEREAFRQALEVMYGRERKYILSDKILSDAAKRLKTSYNEVTRLKKELTEERSVRASMQRDLALVKEDSLGLRESERSLRGARATTLGELSHLRERVREMDQEKIVGSIYQTSSSSSSSFMPLSSAAAAVGTEGVQGVAGLSNARYVRLEEVTVGTAALESSLAGLHQGLIASCPSLLPVFRQLYSEIQLDRAHSIQQRAALLGLNTHSTHTPSASIQQQQRQSAEASRLSSGRSNAKRPAAYNFFDPSTLNPPILPPALPHTHSPASHDPIASRSKATAWLISPPDHYTRVAHPTHPAQQWKT